ncbi:MAG: Stp1/IreP family PP2C-type Ser/Thr phosphatase [Acidimicrobiaceae bacterium]|nr:Stp1/IreP family PP2C-type Ser/Thr phosphatase [Acidimicrobiaceae bacterium]HAY68772.1 Stp1/IreP family PP2C-type Ser/Thr phosphatase [Acidimicrobiaceae bacterium]
MFGLRMAAGTHVGVTRQVNQDSYATAPGVAVVADGMGGHRGGEVASAIAAKEMISRFDAPELDALVTGVGHANRRILDEAAADPKLHGMGTTVVALGLIDVADGVALGAINVGDSRMYRLTGNVLEQLTEDHSLVEALVREGRITAAEAKVHPQRNIVTRALGVIEHVEVDSFHFVPKIGDRYLLCSDGLFNEVDANTIATILATEADPEVATQKLIAAANEGGGHDNITTVIADVVAAEDASMPSKAQALASLAVVDEGDPTNEQEAIIIEDKAEDDAVEAAVPKQRWSWRR